MKTLWLLLLATLTALASPPTKEEVLATLEHAQTLRLSSLDPQAGISIGHIKARDPLLGSVKLQGAERARLVSAFRQGLAEGRDTMKCFEPRHTIVAKDPNGQGISLTICFRCEQVYALRLGEEKHVVYPISPSPQSVFNAILKAHGIAVAP